MAKIVIALLLVLAFANAETLTKARLRSNAKETNSEAHYQALKQTPFGKNLFNMMSLKFKTSGQLDNVLNLLDELNSNIAQQQADDDATFSATSASYTQVIDDENAIIVDAQSNIDTWTQQVSDDTDALAQATSQRDSLVAEAENINEFLAQLADTRAKENAAYTQRQSDQSAILAGLDEVIQLFSAELDNDPNLDHDAAEAVLDLLNEIRASVEASMTEDTTAENDAQVKYNNFVADQNERLSEIASSVSDLDNQIDELSGEIDTLTQGIADETVRRDNASALRDTTQAALDAATATHDANTQVRSSQTVLIGQVKTRLTSNSDDVQGFLNDA
jgi:regulator of replication initiation timing